MNKRSDRHPRHEKALRLEDLHVGQRIVEFNIFEGITGEYEVLSVPSAPQGSGNIGQLHVSLRNLASGKAKELALGDMGIAPHGPNWNYFNFTVDSTDRDSLPPTKPDPRLPGEILPPGCR